MSTSTFRLPKHVTPQRYDVQLDARLGRETFNGKVRIRLAIHETADSIDLHARGLDITNAILTVADARLPATVKLDPENERAVLQFPVAFPVGEGSLELSFAGKVSQSLRGLYLAQDRPYQLLCTQCEATEARAIFPCFDEPTFKARFAFEITTAADAVVLANGPLLSTVERGDSRTWSFAPTKKMSSYLVALVIGDLASTSEIIVQDIPLKVWAMRGKEDLGEFALEYTARLLPWYEVYLGAPYHFDKYDQVAVPGFAAGAMENSGLVIFRQEALIMSQAAASWSQEKSIAHVIAHEFAHMWFGNFVTMEWWDDLWLNEAFAEWVSYRAVSDISPHYRMWDDFQGSKKVALTTDALASTHPIYSPVETPSQAEELFDAITYLKGCSVLRMLENFLGQEDFRAGLRTYMQEFGESNARGADLWRHLQAASHQPVDEIMGSWILQSGFPLVSVALEGGLDKPRIRLSQKRFFSNPQAEPAADQSWMVPLVVRYGDAAGVHELRHVMNSREESLDLPVDGALAWCYANANEVGFYRQNLTGQALEILLDHLDQLTPSEQIGLLGDQWALIESGNQSVDSFLETANALAAVSDHYNLLSQLVGYMKTLEKVLEDIGDEQALRGFRGWVRRLFEDRLDRLGFEPAAGESNEVSQQRIWVVNAMTTMAQDPNAVAEAQRWAAMEAEDPAAVDANLAATLVGVSAKFGDGDLFNKHVSIYQARKSAGDSPQLINRYLYTFSAFRQPELVQQTLSLLDEGIAPKEATGPLLGQLFSNRHSQLAAWEYTKANWGTIKGLGLTTGGLIKAAGQLPPSMREDLVAFCEANVKGVADMGYAQALETMDQQAEFRGRIEGDLVRWFKDQAV